MTPCREKTRFDCRTGGGVLVADVLRERLAALAVEDDDAHHSLQAREEVALASLVVVQPADDALPREDEVRLPHRLRQLRAAHQLGEPAAAVLEPLQRDYADAVDHSLFAPWARTKSLTS